MKYIKLFESNDYSEFISACITGDLNTVRNLINVIDPSVNDNYAIRKAAYNGHLEVVKLLLKDNRVDPSDGNNLAIRWAAMNDHDDVVILLLRDKRVQETLTKDKIAEYGKILTTDLILKLNK